MSNITIEKCNYKILIDDTIVFPPLYGWAGSVSGENGKWWFRDSSHVQVSAELGKRYPACLW